MKIINLKQDTLFTSGYHRGKRIPSETKVFPAGTEATYIKQVTKSGTYHTAIIFEGVTVWEANKKEDK